ncbi:MAG: hypothetical protein ABI378_11835 [Chitinophagaceae bacterium]
MNLRLPIILLIAVVALSIFFKLFCDANPGYDFPALMVANLLMFGLSLIGWFMLRRRSNQRAQVFVQGVYGTTMLRLFVCIIGILAYALINKPNVHKPSLFMMFGIYIIYMAIETIYFSRITRKV